MKVLKFGGSSVGSAEGLSQVKRVVESAPEETIVVVSALGGITDQLLATARKAASGDETYTALLNAMIDRHFDLADEGAFTKYKTVWLCRDCKKMVFNMPDPPAVYDPFAPSEDEDAGDGEEEE